MPEEGNKDIFNPEESIGELGSFIKKSEQNKKRREKRIEKSFSKIDKYLENLKNKDMTSPEKNTEEIITWPEMHRVLQLTSDDGKPIIESEYLVKVAKNLSTGGENRVTKENLEYLLRRVDDGYYSGEFQENEKAIICELIDGKLTEKRNIAHKKEILKNTKTNELANEENWPEFFIRRKNQEKELDVILKKDERELTEVDKMRTIQLVESLYRQPLMEMNSASFFGESSEKPPKVEDVGVDVYREWFENKIHALIEEYPDQNFETNWTLIYTLQQGVNSLWPKEGQDKFKYKIKGSKGQEVVKEGSYSELRKKLAEKLEAYRAIHNFVYLYRRVPGVGEAIGPAGLLDTKYIHLLLREKGQFKGRSFSVADALRKFYEMGEEYRNGQDENQQKEIKKRMEKFQEANWQGRVAGGLYSAFQGGGRDGHITLNQGGDFFTGRLYNMSAWAKRSWEKWGRRPWLGMYKALGLRVKDFWNATLEEVPDQKLKDLNIKKESINGEVIYRFNGQSRFEEIDLVNNQNISPDHVKQIMLNLEEADNIRKMILNPKGLLDEPNFSHIKPMWEKFKHLKAAERSSWFAPVIKELSFFFKDEVAPWSDSMPLSMRGCRAKEVYPYINPLDNRGIIDILGGLTPPLTPEDMEGVLTEVVGPKAKRGAQKAGNVIGGTIWSMILEGIKAGLGMK